MDAHAHLDSVRGRRVPYPAVGREGVRAAGGPLPAYTLLLVAVIAVAATGQGAYYRPVQAIVGLGLAATLVLAVRAAALSRDDLRCAPVPACAALAAWAVASAAIARDVTAAGGYVAMLAGLCAVIVVCRRLDRPQRDAVVVAMIVLGALVAASGWVGLVWRSQPWALEHDGLWRAATTLTYSNAAAGLLAALALLSLARLVTRPRCVATSLASCLLLVGVTATLSRAGAVSLLCGALVLAAVGGPRGVGRAAAPPVIGAVIALGGLVASIPASLPPQPVLAAVALVGGLAAAAMLSRAGWRGLAGSAVALVAACSVAVAGLGGGGGLIGESRLGAPVGRADASAAALGQALAHPLAGTGPGSATLAATEARGRVRFFRYAHNEYLQVFAELGAIGLALLIAVIATSAARVWRGRPPSGSRETWAGVVAALAALAVHSAFDFLWHVPVIVLTAALLIGIANEATPTTSNDHRAKGPVLT